MAVAAVLQGFVVPIVHAHEHMPLAPAAATSDAAVVDTSCDSASHSTTTDAALDVACGGTTHEHAPEKSKGHTAQGCSGNGACCGVLLGLQAAASAAPDKYTPDNDRTLTLFGVEPAGLDRPPALLSV